MSELKTILLVIAGAVCFVCIVGFSYTSWIRPHKLIIDESEDCACIRYRWIKKMHFFLIFTALVLLWVIPDAIRRDVMRSATFTLPFDTLMLITLCIAILYTVATGIFNSTILFITGRTLVVMNQPLPTLRRQRHATYEVQEVYYKKEYSYQKTDPGWVYRFFAKTNEGQTIKVLDSVELEEAAIQIDQVIQNQLFKQKSDLSAIRQIDTRSYIDKLRGYQR